MTLRSFIAVSAFLFSSTVLAESSILPIYSASDFVRNSVAMVEDSLGVRCGEGASSFVLSSFGKRVKYKATCEKFGEKVKLSIISKVVSKGDAPEFAKKKIVIKSTKAFAVENETDNKKDPFVSAFQTSSLVTDVRNMVRDEFSVACKTGSTKRGIGLSAGHYFHRTKCMVAESTKEKIKLKIKGEVKVLSPSLYTFQLNKVNINF